MSEIMTIDELAAWLKVSRRSVYEMTSARGRELTRSNSLRSFVSTTTIRFVREDVQAWLQRQREAA